MKEPPPSKLIVARDAMATEALKTLPKNVPILGERKFKLRGSVRRFLERRARTVDVAPAHPMKRARKAAGIRGRKAAKAFRREFRAAS